MDKLTINYSSINDTSLILDGHSLILVSAETIDLYPENTLSIKTGVSLYFTDKFSGILVNRQVQAENKIILPMSGFIYNGICENISIILSNYSSNTYKIKAGITKIAAIQLVSKLRITKEIILEKNVPS